MTDRASGSPGAMTSKWMWRAISLLAFACLWELAGRYLHLLLVPRFGETVWSLARLSTTWNFWHAFWVSNQALLLGFAAAAVVGVPLGLTIGRIRKAERFSNFYLDLMLVMPISALIPVVVAAFGVGLMARWAVVFLFAFSVIAITAAAGTRSVDSSLVEMSLAFGASRRQLWTRILIPSALPTVMTGLRMGLARAIAGMVIVELLMVAAGIGGLILEYQADFEAAATYAVILATVAEAVLLMKLLEKAESRVLALFR